MGSSSVWGNIRGFTVMEYVRSRDSGIFQRWWAKVVSPYSLDDNDNDEPMNVEAPEKSAEAQLSMQYYFYKG